MWAECSGQQGGEEQLLKVEERVIELDPIPYVGQLEIANVPVEGCIIDHNVHGLLYFTCDAVHLPTHYGVVHIGVMTCGVSMVTDGRRVPKMFPDLFAKGSYRFPCVFLITPMSIKLGPVDYSAFLCNVVPVLRGHQKVLTVVAVCFGPWQCCIRGCCKLRVSFKAQIG